MSHHHHTLNLRNRTARRFATLTLVIAAAATMPAYAGLKDFGQKVGDKVTGTVKAAPGNAQAGIADIGHGMNAVAGKLDEVVAPIREHEGIMDRFRDSPVIDGVNAAFDFLEETREDYLRFAQDPEPFRESVKQLFSDFLAMGQLPGVSPGGSVLNQLQNAIDLVDRLPTPFLYVFKQAVGPRLPELQNTVTVLIENLAVVANLPETLEIMVNPEGQAPYMCPLVTDRSLAPRIAILQTQLKKLVFIVGAIKDLMPQDLTVTVNVAAGAGTTLATHPARVPWHVVGTFLLGTIELEINSKVEIAKSMSSAGMCDNY